MMTIAIIKVIKIIIKIKINLKMVKELSVWLRLPAVTCIISVVMDPIDILYIF